MTHLMLDRSSRDENGTFGMLSLDGKQLAVTCEPPWRNNEHGDSCIPTGDYHCIKHNGERFKNVWELQDVPDREAILIHNGNSIKDTHGCILVGHSLGHLNGLPSVTESVATLNHLRSILPDEFDLTIT